MAGGGDHVITGNYVGTDVTGQVASGNGTGIVVDAPRSVWIGREAGVTGQSPNVISGNRGDGVLLAGGSGHFVCGNLIGLPADTRRNYSLTETRPTPIGNGGAGVVVFAVNNTIGGPISRPVPGGSTPTGLDNLITGNEVGILLGAGGNTVEGNMIGSDADAPLGSPWAPNISEVTHGGEPHFAGNRGAGVLGDRVRSASDW